MLNLMRFDKLAIHGKRDNYSSSHIRVANTLKEASEWKLVSFIRNFLFLQTFPLSQNSYSSFIFLLREPSERSLCANSSSLPISAVHVRSIDHSISHAESTRSNRHSQSVTSSPTYTYHVILFSIRVRPHHGSTRRFRLSVCSENDCF